MQDAWADQDAAEPFGWGKEFSWWKTLRFWQVAERSFDVLAADADARIVHPFAAPAFAQALAQLPRKQWFTGRTAGMEMLFGDDLPASVIGRANKATFDGAFFNGPSRSLARTWQGEGADEEHVDANILRDLWNGRDPDARSFLLLQSAWLARERSSAPLVSPSTG